MSGGKWRERRRRDIHIHGISDILEFAKKLTESEKKTAEAQEALAGQEGNDGEASNQNTQQPPAEQVLSIIVISFNFAFQVTPECLKGPTPKRGKPSDDDQMDLD